MRPFSCWCRSALRWHQRTRQCHNRLYSVRVTDDCHPYPKSVADLKECNLHQPVTGVEICGWVRSVRKSSGVRFVDVTDGSSMRPVQAIVDKSLAGDIRAGAAVRLKGRWQAGLNSTSTRVENRSNRLPESVKDVSKRNPQGTAFPTAVKFLEDSKELKGSNQQRVTIIPTTSNDHINFELQADEVEILGSSDPQSYPIQNKYQTPESLRTMTHLRSRTPLNSTLLRFRSDATALLTQFFFNANFQHTHTPVITSSDCEGAGEAFTVKAHGPTEYFRDPKFLTVSSQLHLEALSQSLGNVWTLSPTFRAEKSDTSRHLSEFQMLEAEMTFINDMEDVMSIIQDMLVSLARGLQDRRAYKELTMNREDSKDPVEKLAFEDLVDAAQLGQRWRGILNGKKWPRVTYTEAIEILRPVADTFEHKPTWGAGLQSEHERYLAEKIGYDEASNALMPIFVTQYPRDIKAFYMRKSAAPPVEGSTVDCFDLLVPSLGELAGGSMREHRLFELEENMRLHGLELPKQRVSNGNTLSWYLDLRRWGCPPHGGFGLGFDRLLSYLTGVSNIRDVVPFPRHFERCDC